MGKILVWKPPCQLTQLDADLVQEAAEKSVTSGAAYLRFVTSILHSCTLGCSPLIAYICRP